MYPAGQKVDVILNHVKSCSRCREPCNPVHTYHPAASGRNVTEEAEDGGARAARHGDGVVCLGALARPTGAYVFRNVDVLAHPEGEAPDRKSVV